MKKFWIFAIFLCSLFLFACKEPNLLEIQGEEKLEIGFSYEYKFFFNGVEIRSDEVYFNVSNLNICDLKDTTITALESGYVTLTIALKEDPTIYISKQLEIIPPLVSDIKIKGDKTVNEGEQILLEAFVTPEDAMIPVIWESSDPSVASVDEGIITGHKGGTVTITAKCSSAKAEFVVTVIEIIREIKVEGNNEIEVNATQAYQFNIKDPIITTDSTNIAIMNNVVYGLESGKAVLHIVSESNPNLELDYEINVINNYNNHIEMTEEERKEIDSIMESLTVEQKLGQMIVLNLRGNNLLLDEMGLYFTSTSNGSPIRTNYLSDIMEFPIGNIIVTNYNSSNKNSLNNYIKGMQDVILDDAGIGAIVLCDKNGNVNSSLTNGFTSRIDNLMFGTANDINLFKDYYETVANEMNYTGINTVVYSSYTRSNYMSENFSGNDVKQILYSSSLRSILAEKEVNVGSYYGMFSLDNDFANNEKLLKTAINDNLDFLMTYNSMSYYWNKGFTIPSYVRELGYEGIIMSSVSDFNTIVNNNEGMYTPAIKYCIENGYDLIPLNLYTSSSQLSNNRYTFDALKMTVNSINKGEIDIELVNAAVERILLYKLRNNIINGTYPKNIEFEANNTLISEATNASKFITISGEFDGLNTDKTIRVFSTITSNGDWRNPVYYDLGEVLLNNKASYGYKEVVKYLLDASTVLEEIEKIQSDDQVVIGIYELELWYEITENNEEYWVSVLWSDIIQKISEKTQDIVIVNMESPSYTKSLESLGYPIICMNGNYDSTFKALLKTLKSGKSNGVSYYE